MSLTAVSEVPVCPDKMSVIQFNVGNHSSLIIDALKDDQVVLIKRVPENQIDTMIFGVAAGLGLQTGLELQSGFAEMYGHRKKLSKYYMTVNRRADYQCTLPHSEGSSFQNIQLVSFYCYENSTDGGETTLFNTDDSKPQVWDRIRERATRAKISDENRLTPAQIAEARMRYQINLPQDLLMDEDEVLKREH